MIYKVSYVVVGKPNLGTIVNLDTPPRVGDRIHLDDELLEVTEVIDLIPPREDFAYLHVTCRPVQEAT
jgi:hypothetical protein